MNPVVSYLQICTRVFGFSLMALTFAPGQAQENKATQTPDPEMDSNLSELIQETDREPLDELGWNLGKANNLAGNSRQRSLILNKANPMASDLMGSSDVGVIGSSSQDAEGFDFFSSFSSSSLLEETRPSFELAMELFYNQLAGSVQLGGEFDHRSTVRPFKNGRPLGYRFRFKSQGAENQYDQIFLRWRQFDSGALDGEFYPRQVRYYRRLAESRSHSWNWDVDYQIADHHVVFFKTYYNLLTEHSTRDELEFRPSVSRVDLSQTDAENFTFENSQILRNVVDEPEERNRIRGLMGGELEGELWKLQYHALASHWKRDESGQLRAEFRKYNVDYALSLPAESRFSPDWSVNDGSDIFDPNGYEFREVYFEDTITEDMDLGGGVDFVREVDIGPVDSQFKVGGLYRQKTRTNDKSCPTYTGYNGDFTLNEVAGLSPIGSIVQDRYNIGSTPDADLVREHFISNSSQYVIDPNRSQMDSESDDFEAFESVAGAYLSMEGKWNRLWGQAGIRMEATQTDTTGNQVVSDDQGAFLFTRKQQALNDYVSIFPTLEARFQIQPRLQIRAGWYTAIARPNYFDLAPYQRINPTSLSILQGNPSLEPVEYQNYILALDKDTQHLGAFSTGITYKQVDGFFYDATQIITSGEFDGYESRNPANGDSAEVWIPEVSWRYPFQFIPASFGSLSSYILYSYTEAEAEVPTRPGEILPLPEVSKNLVSYQLEFDSRKWATKAGLTYQDRALDLVGANVDYDRYFEDRLILNLSAGYRIAPQSVVTLDFFNVMDWYDRSSEGNGWRPTKNEYTSWRMQLGARVAF